MSTAVYYSNAPRCLVTFTDVSGDADTITIYRTTEGRSMVVRGGERLSAATPFVMDYEVAVGVVSTYRAQMFADDGTDLGFTGQVSVTVPATEGSWLSQPLSPETALRVRVSTKTGESINRPSPGEIIYPEGAEVGTIIGGQRRGVAGMVLQLWAPYEDLGKIDGMLGGYGQDYPNVLLLRTPPPARYPRVFFAGILDPEELRYGLYALSGVRAVVSEVRPPFPGLVRSLLRRADIDAAFATRAARAAAYATRLARDQDYTKAGLAP